MPAVRVETDRRFRPEMLAFMCDQCPRKQILEEFLGADPGEYAGVRENVLRGEWRRS